jgi:Ammonia monooxygenase/methane monooxygenase, subunit C
MLVNGRQARVGKAIFSKPIRFWLPAAGHFAGHNLLRAPKMGRMNFVPPPVSSRSQIIGGTIRAGVSCFQGEQRKTITVRHRSISAARPLVDLKFAWIATAVLCAFFIGVRTYEQYFNRMAGIDAFSGEFQLYWLSVLEIAEIAEFLCFFFLVAYLWKPRDLDLANIEPREELRRIFHLLVFFGWFTLAVFGVTRLIHGRLMELCSAHEELLGTSE